MDFVYNDRYIAIHSDIIQWQAIGGYNDFYDEIFDTVTEMDKEKIPFDYNGKEYIIWTWKGNYLNLGAGAEVGFYRKLIDGEILEQWTVCNIFPMTLSLYNDMGNDTYSTYYNWMPEMEQWWITGFVPETISIFLTDEELLPIASVDFSKDPEMYEALKLSFEYENEYLKESVVLDDDLHTIWITW